VHIRNSSHSLLWTILAISLSKLIGLLFSTAIVSIATAPAQSGLPFARRIQKRHQAIKREGVGSQSDVPTIAALNTDREVLMQVLRKTYRRTLLVMTVVCLLSPPVLAHTGSGIAVDRNGQVYFLDTGSGLWRIDTHGRLTRLSGLKNHWLALDATDGFAGARLPTDPAADWLITKVGANPTLLISTDFPIAIGEEGNLYYPSGRTGGVQIIRAMPSGETTVLARLPLTIMGRPLPHINGITGGSDCSLYYTEDTAIRRITPSGMISTVATVRALAGGPSIPGTNQHPYLRGLAVDVRGVMYVADNGDARVLKITPEGKVTTLVQLQSPWSPTGVALFGSDVYVLEFLHTATDDRRAWLPRVRKITSDGKSTIVATVEQMAGARD
jgi:DNA-binding beta-propeller fold protein YncE